MYKILIVEDDQPLARQIRRILEKYHYNCAFVEDFQTIDRLVQAAKPDVILLDVNLPSFDGFYWCRKIRELTKTPILMISARNDTVDQIRGMESGADDYITKPFEVEVLLAKIQATVRRNYGELKDEVSSDIRIEKKGIRFYPTRLFFAYAGQKVELTATESNIFSGLLSCYPDAVTRDELFLKVWDAHAFVEENTLNVNIRRLRNKLREKQLPFEIKSIRGYGYQLVIGGTNH